METVCDTCMHHCNLKEGQWGRCRARKCENSKIVCKNYGIVSSLALDPIEKKPLYMFYPKSYILSVGSYGCNLACPFCQNHSISMDGGSILESPDAMESYLSPKELADIAKQYEKRGNIGVAFTYNEPLIGWEYVLDSAKLIKKQGMKIVIVTNGSASLKILEKLIPYTDAMNVDLKGFNDDYYKMVGGDFNTVRQFIEFASKDCHVEITTLIIPDENDSIKDMEKEAEWIAAIDNNIPLHVTRFFPRYKMHDRDATDIKKIHELADTAKKNLNHVFIGNC